MAQTQHTPRIHDASDTNADTNADQAAWCRAAATRKYKVDDDRVWQHSGGMLFEVPAPVGFASLDPAVQPFVCQALVQHVGARIGQTAEGNVQNAVRKAMRGEDLPRANDSDAYEAVYVAYIERLMKDRANINPPAKLDRGASAEEKKARETALATYNARVEKTADQYRGQLFDKAVAAAKTNIVRPETEKKRRTSSAGAGVEAVELGDLA
jgi:hypothetical protein